MSGRPATPTSLALDAAAAAAAAAQTALAAHEDGNASKHDATEIDYERADGSKKNIAAGSDTVEAALANLDDATGALSSLTTTEKGSAVGAINEVKALATDAGTLAEQANAEAMLARDEAADAQTDADTALGVLGNQPALGTGSTPTFAGMLLTGGLRLPARFVSATGGVTAADCILEVDTTAGAVTLNLPAIAAASGQLLIIRRVAGANNLILDGNGNENIEGSGTVTISDNNTRRYYAGATQWRTW